MKRTCLLLATVLCMYTANGQNGIDTLLVQQDADTVYILNNNIFSNCGSSFMTTASLSGDSIAILESDTSHQPLRCMCYFDVNVALTGLSPGTYRAFVFRDPMDLDTIYLIGSVTFTRVLPGSPAFSSHALVSDCHTSPITSVITPGVPKTFSLLGNYPNPFNPATIIRYQIHQSSRVKIEIFNELGRFVTTLVNEEKPVGDYEITWNASHLSSGTYFCKLTAGNEIQTQKMTLIK